MQTPSYHHQRFPENCQLEFERCRNLYFVIPTPAEWNEMLAAKLAHIFVLEVRKAVPWRLADYSSEALNALFNVCRYDCTHIVLDYSPRVAWNVLQQKIDLTALVGRA